MSLTGASAILPPVVWLVSGGLGYLVPKWRLLLIPPLALVALDTVLRNQDLYSRMPEEWQAATYIGLAGGTFAAALGIWVRKLT